MSKQKPSVEAKLEGYRQQQSATRGPTKTQRKGRGAFSQVVDLNEIACITVDDVDYTLN